VVQFPKIAVIAVYMGKLPSYFPLWLASCSYNPDFDWLVFTDADFTEYNAPPNVKFRKLTLANFVSTMSRALKIELQPITPYKICDFRPIFWALLQGEPTNYEFWGHCDIDMLFGDLRAYITPSLLDGYDKIFSVGHFTLYRNNDVANNMYRRPHPTINWKKILSDSVHRGFDEHNGVNLIWEFYGGRVYQNETIIADIDPHLSHLELVLPAKNYLKQVFFFEKGKILRGYYANYKWHTEPFMYIHFQKRRFDFVALAAGTDSFYVTQRGFIEKIEQIPTPQRIQSLNPIRLWSSYAELAYRLRSRMKNAVVSDMKKPWRSNQ
jgi:hypothetical protein